jgi:hypothetical protein
VNSSDPRPPDDRGVVPGGCRDRTPGAGEVKNFEPRPPTAAIVPAVIAAGLNALLVAAGSTTGFLIAGPGAALLLYGARVGARRYVTIGGALGFAGTVVGAAAGLPISLALVGGVAALVAYDTAEHAVTLGVDVGTNAPVGQSTLVHAFGSVVVASLAAAVGYGIYEVGPTSVPVTGLVALLFAAVLLTYALGD